QGGEVAGDGWVGGGVDHQVRGPDEAFEVVVVAAGPGGGVAADVGGPGVPGRGVVVVAYQVGDGCGLGEPGELQRCELAAGGGRVDAVAVDQVQPPHPGAGEVGGQVVADRTHTRDEYPTVGELVGVREPQGGQGAADRYRAQEPVL